MEFAFPGFFYGPAAGVDNLYNETRRLKISEVQPLVNIGNISEGIWKPEIGRFSYWMGLMIPALPVMITKLFRTPNPDKMFWVFLFTLFVVYIPHTFLHLRWIHYSVIILILPYAYLVSGILRKMDSLNPGILTSASRIFVILLSAGIFTLPAYIFNTEPDTDTKKLGSVAERCDVKSIALFLNSKPGIGDSQNKIMAFVDDGPEILYRTNHFVYSIPSHRHQHGYTISYNMMNSATDDDALHYANKGQPDYILICPSKTRDNFYSRKDDKVTFYQRVAKGEHPSWLSEVTIPEDVNTTYKLLDVQPAN